MSNQIPAGFAGIADAYGTAGGEFFLQIARRLVDVAGILRGDRVMDIGCGKGAATIPAALAAGPGGEVIGIDSSLDMLEQAIVDIRRFRLINTSFYLTDATDPLAYDPWEDTDDPQPFPAGFFNALLASNLLVFLPDPHQALRNWHRLLRPGGRVAFSWGIAQDPRWAPVIAAVDSHVPKGIPGFEEWVRRPPIDGPAHVEDMLTDCGYVRVETTEQNITTIYDSPDEWWTACQSSAPWAVSWQHIRDCEAAKKAAFSLLEGMRNSDGMLCRTLKFGFTLARKYGG